MEAERFWIGVGGGGKRDLEGLAQFSRDGWWSRNRAQER